MKATITKITGPHDTNNYRQSATRFTAYTDGKARDVADREYLAKFNLGQYGFPIRSWSRVAGLATSIEAAAVKAAVEAEFPGVTVEVKYSRKAGCSCGCSPGYIGKIVSGDFGSLHGGHCLSRANVWLTEENLTADETAAIVARAAQCAEGLPAEIARGEAELAKAKAEREERCKTWERDRDEIEDRRRADKARWEQEMEKLISQSPEVERESAMAMC